MEISQLEAFVARVEEWMNEPLLDRSIKSGQLTEGGKIVYDYAKKILNLRLEARSAVEELKALERGTLSIGANESTALHLLPILQKFRERHPRVRVTVKRALSREIPNHLLRHEIDLGILSFD